MDPSNVVAQACAHQDTLVHILAWAGGVMPVASALAWLTARWNSLPVWAQSLLQVFAGNFIHAVAGEPKSPRQ